ncbi:hypothetical protein H6F86_04740 [Phormidium sp. FACHB-592]|uniref:hypothetical protein n=1 Tax=Phormidium sp. FACHB-592 TaxID=2692850 RepID=UPI0019B9DBAA|nr:hypothetical protein [Phormidium sp. FACHB-592]MBD2073204.1 hypothetical protein [Phormidium sp. FACHB-592]
MAKQAIAESQNNQSSQVSAFESWQEAVDKCLMDKTITLEWGLWFSTHPIDQHLSKS